MPELMPHYDRVCNLVGDDDLAHRMLSHYRPAPVVHGCSQAVWLGDDGPALVRNYDFPLDVVSDRFELTAWSGREVIAKVQRPWGGCRDVMNEDGLVATTTGNSLHSTGRIAAISRTAPRETRAKLQRVSRTPRAPDAPPRMAAMTK